MTAVRYFALLFLFASCWWLGLAAGLVSSVAAAGAATPNAPAAQPSASPSLWSWVSADSLNAISGNPGAVNVQPGIGLLGRTLGFGPDSGVFLGGLWSGDADYLIGGGVDPKSWNLNSLELIGLDLDFEKLIGLSGGEFGATFLQFDGQPSNSAAGVVTGYDGLTGPPSLDRSELYQLWWRQRLLSTTSSRSDSERSFPPTISTMLADPFRSRMKACRFRRSPDSSIRLSL